MRYISHDFYCIKCGRKGIPIPRVKGNQHGKFHRKKLFCLTCQKEVNHIECRNQGEINQFKEDFENGVYKDEAEQEDETFSNVWTEWRWENNIYKTANC